jgi:ribosomal protein S18 acetylase RimI-like enzyme
MSATYVIRSLTREDIPAFMMLRAMGLERYPEAFGESIEEFRAKSPDAVAERILSAESTGGFTLGGFKHDGTLVGVVGMARLAGAKSRHRGYVWGMIVSPEEHGKGLGRTLLQECITRSRRVDGLEQLVLSVGAENIAASKLYCDAGFQVYGRDPHSMKVDGRTTDELLMWLPLSTQET